MNIHGPLGIASPAEHRHQDVDEKMWERLEDVHGIKEDEAAGWGGDGGRSREEKISVSFTELHGAAVCRTLAPHPRGGA